MMQSLWSHDHMNPANMQTDSHNTTIQKKRLTTVNVSRPIKAAKRSETSESPESILTTSNDE